MARRRKSTNSVHVKYTEIIDLQTVAGKTSVIGIHTPNTADPVRRLLGLYSSFRFVRYNGCRLNMIPQANLPVDPLGLTGVVGTTDTMDPRDALNPILTHGCHGEHLGRVLDNIYSSGVTKTVLQSFAQVNTSDTAENSSSANKIELNNATDDALSRYYQCLTDVTWKKHGIQAPLSLRCYPLVNRLSSTIPIVPAGYGNSSFAGLNQGLIDYQSTPEGGDPQSATFPLENAPTLGMIGELPGALYTPESGSGTRILPQILTSGLSRLGWLPTTTTTPSGSVSYVTLPKQFMSVLVLPPQYNVEQFFRMSITHSYSFAGFSASLGAAEFDVGQGDRRSNSYFNWIDYDVTSKETDSKYVEGTSLDLIDADASVIADGVR